ncbi:MAG: ACT domain-containing protein [Henriciella sp.]|nr:ACT domain-containing protein [Henriciella sp.]
MLFQESEGLTVVTTASETTPSENRWAWLELSVYSDLQAVGFLAAVAEALAAADIPCNAIAAYHHDHIFVPSSRAADAIATILTLRDKA